MFHNERTNREQLDLCQFGVGIMVNAKPRFPRVKEIVYRRQLFLTSLFAPVIAMINFNTIVLDTDVLSQFAKTVQTPVVRDFIEKTPIEYMAIPFPVLVEILKGIELRSQTSPQHAAWLRHWVNLMLTTDMRFLPADEKTCTVYAKLITIPELRGLWMINERGRDKFPGQDLMVAATAVAYELPIATMNSKDYRLVDSKLPLPGILDLNTGKWLSGTSYGTTCGTRTG